MKISNDKKDSLFYRIYNFIFYSPSDLRISYLIIFVFAVILLITLILAGPNIYPDSKGYIDYANGILQFNFVSPGAIRTPGYPLFIALTWFIIGKGYFQLIIVQIILNALSQILLIKILFRADLKNLVILSLLLYNLSPLSYASLNILTETLTIFLLLAIVFLLVEYNKNNNGQIIYYVSLLIMLLIFTRPQFVFVFIAAGFFLIYRKKYKCGLLIITSILLMVISWSLVNNKYNKYPGFTSLMGYNLIDHTGYFIEYARELNPVFVDIYLKSRKDKMANNNGRQYFTIYDCRNEIMEKLNYDEIKLSKELLRISGYLISRCPDKYAATVFKALVFSLGYNNRYSTEEVVFKYLRMPSPLGLIFYLGGIMAMLLINFSDNFLSILLKVIFFSNLLVSVCLDVGENFRYMIPVLFIPFIFCAYFLFIRKHSLWLK